ncbi:unnamed protein product [Caenorhabditis angaria]|uniref:ZP domain-containing protein n=1 Tax=Caenorhabditis angaria TaxID=860376 RepID=A0A9P1MWG6_9PELO|nr:unnamed protein product [Caenorhabditis angaria]
MLLVFVFFLLLTSIRSDPIKYPNEITDTPLVICESDRIIIKVKTTASNPSHIYVDGKEGDIQCISRNQNRIEIQHDKCGMIKDMTEQPSGNVRRVCITVQLHPLFVTEADRSYCAQCVYVESHVMKDIESTLDISEAPPTQLSPQFDAPSMPQCSYTIRKSSQDGPKIQYASIGDSVYHVWSCDGDHSGILVQNCHVEDGQGNRILIIDQNGCGIDRYVMATPKYNQNQSIAYQETHVFKFAQRTITRFTCQIRICLKGDDCKKLSPPNACPTLAERFSGDNNDAEEEDEAKLQDIPIFNESQLLPDPTLELHPPASQPPPSREEDTSGEFIRRAPTKGSIYYGVGYNPKRHRREVLINSSDLKTPENSRFVMKNGYPHMEMVGELRVFETPQDVEYFESANPPSTVCPSSSSTLFFTLLVTALTVLSILLISVFLLISSRIRSKKNNSIHFAQ